MAADWLRLCRGEDLAASPPHIVVELAEGRRHRVTVSEAGEQWGISAVVVGAAAAARIPELALYVWRRNRATALTGFRLDEKGRLLAETLAPREGLAAWHWMELVRTVALEADRFERELLGRDLE